MVVVVASWGKVAETDANMLEAAGSGVCVAAVIVADCVVFVAEVVAVAGGCCVCVAAAIAAAGGCCGVCVAAAVKTIPSTALDPVAALCSFARGGGTGARLSSQGRCWSPARAGCAAVTVLLVREG